MEKILILKGNLVADATDADLETMTKRILSLEKNYVTFAFSRNRSKLFGLVKI